MKLLEKEVNGLSEKEAKEILKREGYNELPSAKKRGLLRLIISVLSEPMFILILVCGILYFILGDKNEAILLLVSISFMIAINIHQERKTEKALEALKNLSSPRAVVIRDGEKKRIPGREVVLGDILILNEGDRVPADAIILACSNLKVDESLLTGESVSVKKIAADKDIKIKRPGGENTPFIYSGTLIVGGRCLARVKATGLNTEMGRIGKSLETINHEQTLLQKETKSIVQKVGFLSLIICLVVIVISLLTRGGIIDSLLVGITLAIAIIPEEFPVVLTIFLVMGAWRMSKKRVLIRHQAVIQSLGSATVLCVDKTGTLTQNNMVIKEIYSKGELYKINDKKPLEKFHETIEYGILASQKDPFDPMEKALYHWGFKSLKGTEHLHFDIKLIKEYPFSSKLFATSLVWKKGSKYMVACKGAPEAMIELCKLNSKEKNEILNLTTQMAKRGLRVIGVAKALTQNLPKDQDGFDFEFLGLLGFEDPIRLTAPKAIKECHSAGIKVIMITGDYPETAKNIGAQLGFSNKCSIILGPELEKMNNYELKLKIKSSCIFARILPEQKLRIVTLLKENGEIVAMTGDGINDAPALKIADIGIAMGERGTDVAREASSIVLVDDDFSSIVAGIRLGRRVYDNIRKALKYLLAVHIPIAGMTLFSVLSGMPLLLMPVHIVALEFIIDPSSSIVFENEKEESNIMKRKPRDPKEKILDKRSIIHASIQGAILLLFVAFMFFGTLYLGYDELKARTLGFSTLILSNLVVILANRSISKSLFSSIKELNLPFLIVSISAIVVLILTLYIPFLHDVFKLNSLGISDIILILFTQILLISILELLRIFYKK